MGKEIEIFLSYANPDQVRVLEIYNFLQKNGYSNTWIDCERLLPGQNWDYEIQKNLKKADIIIIFLSENSISRRGYIQKEISTTLRYLEEKLRDDIYIIPIKLDDAVIIPDNLIHLQCLKVDSENALIKLKKSLDVQSTKLNKDIPIKYDTSGDSYITKSPTKEVWDGIPGYEIEFEIPIFHSINHSSLNEISKIIEADFIRTLHEYRQMKLEQSPEQFSWVEQKYRRTSIFDGRFGAIFQSDNFLSIHYSIYWNGASSPHPNHSYITYNFILDPLIRITDPSFMFDNPDDVLKKLVAFVRSAIKEEKRIRQKQYGENYSISKTERDSISKNIKDWESLSVFSLSNKGLIFSFLFTYVEGSYHIEVPYKFFCKDLRREFYHALPITFNDDFYLD